MRRRSHRILVVALAVACASPEVGDGPGADRAGGQGPVVATWDGGAVGLAEVERVAATSGTESCVEMRETGGADAAAVVDCYAGVARRLAYERSLVPAGTEPAGALEAIGERYRELLAEALVAEHRERLGGEIEVSEAAIEAFYEDRPERFRQPGALSLWNVFRRHREPEDPEATLRFLEGVRARVLAGESFEAVAREVSDSETRLRGGRVGRVEEGEMASRLEEVAFALPEGGVSEPVPVPGGAVLLMARDIRRPATPPLEQVRWRIRAELTGRRVREAEAAMVGDRSLPEDARDAGPGAVAEALAAGDGERVVLAASGLERSAAEIGRRAGVALDGELGAEEIERLDAAYPAARDDLLLRLALLEDAPADLRERAREEADRRARSLLADAATQRWIEERIAAEPERLREFWRDNRHHYQSPLLFRIAHWEIPFGDEPRRRYRRLEELRDRLQAGELRLDEAVAELGGRVEELEPRSLPELGDVIPAKAQAYLLQVPAGGFSVPYQQSDAFHLVHLRERREPGPLPWEEVADRVRADYSERFEKTLYTEAVEDRLAEVGFRLDEASLRSLLAPPVPAGGSDGAEPGEGGRGAP